MNQSFEIPDLANSGDQVLSIGPSPSETLGGQGHRLLSMVKGSSGLVV